MAYTLFCSICLLFAVIVVGLDLFKVLREKYRSATAAFSFRARPPPRTCATQLASNERPPSINCRLNCMLELKKTKTPTVCQMTVPLLSITLAHVGQSRNLLNLLMALLGITGCGCCIPHTLPYVAQQDNTTAFCFIFVTPTNPQSPYAALVSINTLNTRNVNTRDVIPP